jgi:hypothetical protein
LRRDDERADKQMQLFMGYVQRYTMANRKKGTNGVRMARSYFKRARGSADEGLLAPWWR